MTDATRVGVRAKFGLGASRTAVVQDVVEGSRARLTSGGYGVWRPDSEFEMHGIIAMTIQCFNARFGWSHVQHLISTTVDKGLVLEIDFFCGACC